jgi:BolA family transcriptional regulator, general stress-responsive regulator
LTEPKTPVPTPHRRKNEPREPNAQHKAAFRPPAASLTPENRISLSGIMRYATPMRTQDLITRKLTEAFAPESLSVVDESHQHEGHAGHRPGGQTHFRVYIVSEAFKGKSRVERHRMINAALAAELAGGIHAFALHATAPGEGAA